jgi:hypothetical protein
VFKEYFPYYTVIAPSTAKVIALSKAKMIAVLKFNQQDNSDRSQISQKFGRLG